MNNILGLKEEADNSLSRLIFVSLFRSLVLVVLLVAVGFGLSVFSGKDYRSDDSYDKETLANIEFENEAVPKLEAAFAEGNYAEIRALYDQNYHVVSNWKHYPVCEVGDTVDRIVHSDDEELSAYEMSRALEVLFDVDSITYRRKIVEEDQPLFAALQAELLTYLETKGYTYPQLESFYTESTRENGYIDTSRLRELMEEK